MPEVTENYVRIPVPGRSGYKIKATITISAGQGIKALIGTPPGSPGAGTKVVTYLFDRSKWSMAEAQKWVREHELKESKETHLWEAVWSTAMVNDLPDSSFVYIEPGGEKDAEGKTKPRSLRHLPVKDASGKLDPAHVRNALARMSQMSVKLPAAAVAKLRGYAKQLNIGEAAEAQESVLHDDLLEGVMVNAKVDRQNNAIFGVKLLGLESKAADGSINWRYTDKARQEFATLMEGAKWYVDHPDRDSPEKVRAVRDLGGIIRNVQVRADGNYGDLNVAMPKTQNAWIFDLVESCPEAVGMSQNAVGYRRFTKPVHQIEGAKSLRSVDMVTDPATTRNLFESKENREMDEMKWEDITIETLREQRNDLVEQITEEVRRDMDNSEKIKELETLVEQTRKEKKETDEKLDKANAELSGIKKRQTVETLIAESKLPEELRTDALTKQLLEAKDAEAMKEIVADRKAIWEKATGRPIAAENDALQDIQEGVTDPKKAREVAQACVAGLKA